MTISAGTQRDVPPRNPFTPHPRREDLPPRADKRCKIMNPQTRSQRTALSQTRNQNCPAAR